MFVEIALFVGVLLLWLFLNNRRPSGFPPGPNGLPIVGSLPFIKGNSHIKFQTLSKKYGPVLGLKLGGKWVVVLNDFDSMREALKDDVFSERPKLPLILLRSQGRKEGIIFNDGSAWQEQRRFTMRHLRDFGFGRRDMEDLIQEEVQDTIQHLRKDIGKPVDLRFRFNLAVINALWFIVSGEKFNYDDPNLREVFEAIFSVFEGQNLTLNIDAYYPWLLKLWPGLFHVKEVLEIEKRILQIATDVIERHKKTLTEETPRDFIDAYLNNIKSESNPNSSFYGKKGEYSLLIDLIDLFEAGTDTTSTTLYWTFLMLVLHPDVQQKMHHEIDQVVGRSRPSSLQDKPKMPYTEAVTAEVLRYSSILIFALFHSTTKDTVFRGFRIPKDTIIIPNQYAVNYDTERWENPEIFRPERFLASDGSFKKEENVTAFGIGKRVCLGETLARSELFLFVTGLLQNFRFTYPPEEKPSSEALFSFLRSARTYRVILHDRDL